MAPKKTTTATKTDTKAATEKKSGPAHPPYAELIKAGILALKERNGSSRQKLKKYIQTNFPVTTKNFDSLFNAALRKGTEKEIFIQPKGPSGPVKLNKAKKEAAPKKAPAPAKKETKAAAPVKKAAAPKKAATPAKKAVAGKVTKKAAAAPKKAPAKKAAAAPKKAPAKKAAPKKAAAKK